LSVSANYPTPVWVNGYQCRNCSDVDLAKKHIDPAHPKSGPFNVDAKSDPSRILQDAVQFGGLLAGTRAGGAGPGPAAASATGTQFDLRA
jgi:hypothetical protein